MCGIYGLVRQNNLIADESFILRISALLQHRGPDDSGQFTEGNVTIGMHRLSIVGVAEGHQP